MTIFNVQILGVVKVEVYAVMVDFHSEFLFKYNYSSKENHLMDFIVFKFLPLANYLNTSSNRSCVWLTSSDD